MLSTGQVTASMRTDQGRVRDHNEDYIASREPTDPDDEAKNGWLYILADGVGGADAGEIASEYATKRTLYHYINDDHSDDWGKRLQNAMRAANTDLRKMVDEELDGKRMATTMVAVVIHDSVASIANIGDSRGYHFNRGNLVQITKDQSLVARLLEEGAISEEEALNHPRKNVILHSIGPESKPQIDCFQVDLEPGERIVLCSDGLTRHVSNEEIKSIVEVNTPDVATQKLIDLANERGGEDNISAAVLLLGKESQSIEVAGIDPVMVSGPDPSTSSRARRILWRYIVFLVIIQIILLLLIWNLLSS